MNVAGLAEAAAHCGLSQRRPRPADGPWVPPRGPLLPLDAEQTRGAPVSCYPCPLPGRPVTLPRPLTAPVPPNTPSRGHRAGGQQRVRGGRSGVVAVPSDPSGPPPGAKSGSGGLYDEPGRPTGGYEAGACRGAARPGEHSRAAGAKPRAEPQPGPAGQSEHRAEVRRGDRWPGHALHRAEGGRAHGGHAVTPARPPPCGSEVGRHEAPPLACPAPCGGEAGLWGDIQGPRHALSNGLALPGVGLHSPTPAWLLPLPQAPGPAERDRGRL